MRKKLTYSVLSLLLGILVPCNNYGQEKANPYNLSTKNNVVYWLTSDISNLIPYTTHDAQSSDIYPLLWESLNGINPRTQELIPWLASLPVISKNHRVYTYTMNPVAKWSDGQPLTAEDVMFSFKTVMNPLLIDASSLRDYFKTIDSVGYVVGDKMKIAFYLSESYYQMDRILGGGYVPILPKHVFDKENFTDKISWEELKSENPSDNGPLKQLSDTIISIGVEHDPNNLIGSGPYVLSEWITNDLIILKRAPHYWSENLAWGKAYPEEIIFKIIEDQNTALIALKAKDIDFMDLFSPPSKWLTINQPYIKKDTAYYNSYTFLAWNKEKPIFKDKRVRRALSHLVNRDEIINNVLKGLAHKIESPIIFTQPNYYSGLEPINYDVDEAKHLLAQSGWVDSDGDGILDKIIDGKKTSFKFTFLVNNGSEVRRQVLLIVCDQLRKVGIQADVQVMEWSVYLQNLHSHNFDATYSAIVGNASEDDLYQLWHSSQAKSKGSNWHSFINPKADRLLERNRKEFDFNKRKELMKRFVEIIHDEQPVTFLWSQPQLMAWIDRFDNIELLHQRPCVNVPFWVVRGAGVKPNIGDPATLPETAVKYNKE
jgi:peptide/nickel transport system substrate-binding protein